MANRQLSEGELTDLLGPLLHHVRVSLEQAAGGDNDLHWALRRKLAKELTYDERGKPATRKRLKKAKLHEQGRRCSRCDEVLPDKGAVLDRFEAMQGYTPENTRLLCRDCDHAVQEERGYS